MSYIHTAITVMYSLSLSTVWQPTVATQKCAVTGGNPRRRNYMFLWKSGNECGIPAELPIFLTPPTLHSVHSLLLTLYTVKFAMFSIVHVVPLSSLSFNIFSLLFYPHTTVMPCGACFVIRTLSDPVMPFFSLCNPYLIPSSVVPLIVLLLPICTQRTTLLHIHIHIAHSL